MTESSQPHHDEPHHDSLHLVNASCILGGKTIIERINIAIEPGEVCCLLGPSGCGKTTTLRLIAGLESLSEGHIRLRGKTIATAQHSLPVEQRSVGLVFQDYALFPHLTVGQNIGFSLGKSGHNHDVVKGLIDDIGLQGLADSYPYQLSGGQQQRVALARSLVGNPACMLLDEPFSNLDARLRDGIRDITLHMLKQRKIPSLIVTHDGEEAMYMADKVCVMHAGKIEQIDRPDQLYYNPANAFVTGFLGEVNRFEGTVKAGSVHTMLGCFRPDEFPKSRLAGLRDGDKVTVLARPEGLYLQTVTDLEKRNHCPPRPLARVLTCRHLGRTSLIHMHSCHHPGAPIHLHARMAGRYLPSDGSIQQIKFHPEHTFVFAASIQQ